MGGDILSLSWILYGCSCSVSVEDLEISVHDSEFDQSLVVLKKMESRAGLRVYPRAHQTAD